MFSVKNRNILKTLVALSEHQKRNGAAAFMRVDDLAKEIGEKPSYLKKIITTFRKKGILETAPGPSGGVRLTTDPCHVKIIDVIGTKEMLDKPRKCIIDDMVCEYMDTCPGNTARTLIYDEILGKLTLRMLGDNILKCRSAGQGKGNKKNGKQ